LAESLAFPSGDEGGYFLVQMISTYLPVGWGGLWSAPCETYQREVEAGEGAGVAGEGGHHLAAGGGPDNDEAVLPAFPRVKGGIGTL